MNVKGTVGGKERERVGMSKVLLGRGRGKEYECQRHCWGEGEGKSMNVKGTVGERERERV